MWALAHLGDGPREFGEGYHELKKLGHPKVLQLLQRLFTNGPLSSKIICVWEDLPKASVARGVLPLCHQRVRLPDGFTVDYRKIEEYVGMFQTKSPEHKETRGVHSSALADGKDILVFRDDIGRHNAIDKVIGEALCRGLEFENKMILTSGRVSSEILSKLLRCRIPIIVAAGAPTNQAVKLAKNVNLTVVGLARGSIMCIFSGEERIV